MSALDQQHWNMAFSHKRHRLAVTPVITFLKKLIQQQSDRH